MAKPIIELKTHEAPSTRERKLFHDALRDVLELTTANLPAHVPAQAVSEALELCRMAAEHDVPCGSTSWYREAIDYLQKQEPDALVTIEA